MTDKQKLQKASELAKQIAELISSVRIDPHTDRQMNNRLGQLVHSLEMNAKYIN